MTRPHYYRDLALQFIGCAVLAFLPWWAVAEMVSA